VICYLVMLKLFQLPFLAKPRNSQDVPSCVSQSLYVNYESSVVSVSYRDLHDGPYIYYFRYLRVNSV
jgi:hypothetical protein